MDVGKRNIAKPKVRQWLLHVALFVATAITTTISGIIWCAGPDGDVAGGTPAQSGGLDGSILLVPWYYVRGIGTLAWQALTHPTMLLPGLTFSAALLAILTAHEFGHYFFCRHYGVDATLPFFIPQPPGLLPGTFGAFIRMKSPVPSRRALFDIGLAAAVGGFIRHLSVSFRGVPSPHPA